MTGETPEVRSDKRTPGWTLFKHQSASIPINQHQSASISISSNQHQWAAGFSIAKRFGHRPAERLCTIENALKTSKKPENQSQAFWKAHLVAATCVFHLHPRQHHQICKISKKLCLTKYYKSTCRTLCSAYLKASLASKNYSITWLTSRIVSNQYHKVWQLTVSQLFEHLVYQVIISVGLWLGGFISRHLTSHSH